MPTYEYRCDTCGEETTLTYRTYADYDAATPACSHCGSTSLTRLISRVAISKPSRDYRSMNANEMLSVFESGDAREVGSMMQQVAGDADLGADYTEAANRLQGGESIDNVERDLQAKEAEKKPEPPAKPADKT